MSVLRALSIASVAALVAGCVSYNPSQLAAMSAVDLCELQQMQGRNLSPDTRATIQSELQRRSESCAKYSADLAQRHADYMGREMYGKHDDP